MQYNTRLNGLQVILESTPVLLGEKRRVIFKWDSQTKFPLTNKQVALIEKNCTKYIVAQGLANKLYPSTDDDRVPIDLPPATKGRYVTIDKALEGEF